MSTLTDKERLYGAGILRCQQFCDLNNIPMPKVTRLSKTDRLYHLATCAYYRKGLGISIMVEKCAARGHAGRAWSWPGYAVDRTPYGVMAHELGHHIDELQSTVEDNKVEFHFAREIYERSREAPLTGYLGTDRATLTFYMEWFAEIFRLYVTNPDLCWFLRPKFHAAMAAADTKPIPSGSYFATLAQHDAPLRIINMAVKKVAEVAP